MEIYIDHLIRSIGKSHIKKQVSLYQSTYPTMIVSSLILLVFSYLEKGFLEICNSFALDKSLKLKVSEVAGHSIFRKIQNLHHQSSRH